MIDSLLSALIPAAQAATDAGGDHGGGHSGGLLFSSPEFWVGLAFIVVVVAALKPAGRALTTALDMRAARIQARLDEAGKLAADAQAMLADYQRRQRDAMAQADEIISHARAEAERLAKVSEQRLEESLQRREQAAMERIAQAEAQALADVRNAAVDLAIAAAARVIGENMTDRQAGALVDRAIKDLPDRLN